MESMNLVFVSTVLCTPHTQIHLHQHKNGTLFLSACLEQPEGQVYFATTEEILEWFFIGLISIQQLMEKSPSRDISILVNNNTRIFLCGDVNIRLRNGDNKIHELVHTPL